MLNIRTRIRTDLNPSKRIQSRIRSENIRTVFIPDFNCVVGVVCGLYLANLFLFSHTIMPVLTLQFYLEMHMKEPIILFIV